MIQTINRHQFHRAFEELRPEHFSYEALDLLFDYFEELEEETGKQMELDVIAICCDFSEYSVKNIIENNNIEFDNCNDEDEIKYAVIE